MGKLFSNWADTLIKQNNVIYIDLREYFKCIRNNFRTMKDLVYTVDSKRKVYTKAKVNLVYRKDDLFKRGDPTRWELDPTDKTKHDFLLKDKNLAYSKMCPKDTGICIGYKEVYGHYLNRAIEEYERLRDLNSFKHKEILTNSCLKLIEISNTCLKNYAEHMDAITNKINKSGGPPPSNKNQK